MLPAVAYALIAITLVGCGSAKRDALLKYRETFAQGEYAKARELLKQTKLSKDKDAQLLNLMENGRVAYAEGNLKEAIDFFTQGTELIDAQYRDAKGIQGSKWLVNDASGKFFGATYERSWLFYHLAMSHWRMYQEGGLPREEARKHLFSARAALLAWDSFFQEWQRGTGGKSIYRHDIAAKIVAAQVHEATGVRADLQISVQLYKDAWNLLNTIGPSFPTYNDQAQDYSTKLLSDIAEGRFAPGKKHKIDTPVSTQTHEFLRDKILQLTLVLRPGEMPEIQKQFGFSAADVQQAKKLKPTNVTFILEEGTIEAKLGKTINLGLKGLANLSKDPKTQAQILQIGGQVVSAFAVEILGLGPTKPSEVGQYVLARDLTAVAATEAAIEFEVPEVPEAKKADSLWLLVKASDGKEVVRRPWPVASPLNEVARQTLDEEAGQRILRTGVRVATKHALAIVSAYALYKSLNSDGKNEFIAKMAAVGSYVAATKGIAYSERADTRSWATLPRHLRLTDAAIAEGDYTVSMATMPEQGAPEVLRELGKITIAKGQRAIFTYLKPQL